MRLFRPLFWGLLMGVTACSTFAQGVSARRAVAVRGRGPSVRSGSLSHPIPAGRGGIRTSGKPFKAGDAVKDGISEASLRHNLDGLNALRAEAGLPSLKLDAKLCDFARQGSLELLKTHTPHGHFKSADVWGSGFANAAAENQGDPHGWIPGPVNRAIDQILQAMMDEGPGGGHHDTILSSKYSRVGIGLLQDKDGRLYLTNDFSG